MSEALSHHPIITQFQPAEDDVPEGCNLDYFGLTTVDFVYRPGDRTVIANDPTPFNSQNIYRAHDFSSTPKKHRQAALPDFDHEYWESVDLIESIVQSGDHYIMFELGAGYGRWGIRAYQFLRRHFPKKKAHILFVEAEPVHCDDLKHHLKLNGIPEQDVTLVEAAVSDTQKVIPFYVRCNDFDHPHQWYGQALNHNSLNFQSDDFTAGTYNGKTMYRYKGADQAFINVPCLPLSMLVQQCPRVDLIDMDIQGDEAKAVIEAMDELNKRVKRLHIATHSHEIEAQLRKALSANNWTCLNDYICLEEQSTPYGKIKFIDGVQSWVNPRLA